ncbi:DUF7620 family protein [Streptomyces sp. NRRL S-455]|uniref:DUF7620 family protein n=1 Tax=Streptomyces sp. NRRL S-455 TaxID=1463908 RepID=UPI000A612797|nr:hypothetical protein [Streptomyces sp. NRRL S-455]
MPWRKRPKSEPDPGRSSDEVQAVREALQSLEQDIARAQARTAVISEISRTLRRLGERNHFAPMIKDALGGKFR